MAGSCIITLLAHRENGFHPRLPRTLLSWCVFLHQHQLQLHGCGKFTPSWPFNHTRWLEEIGWSHEGLVQSIIHPYKTAIVQAYSLKIPAWKRRKILLWYPNSRIPLFSRAGHWLLLLHLKIGNFQAGWSAAAMAIQPGNGNSDSPHFFPGN